MGSIQKHEARGKVVETLRFTVAMIFLGVITILLFVVGIIVMIYDRPSRKYKRVNINHR